MPLDALIHDRASYRDGLVAGMADKLDFLDHVDADAFLDFGCADGSLLAALSERRPGARLIGYDVSEPMIAAARANTPQAEFSTEWGWCRNNLKRFHTDRTCLILSSVIHEVLNYGTPDEIATFWRHVWGSGFDYIAIRDTALSANRYMATDKHTLRMIYRHMNPPQLAAWEKRWGTVRASRSAIHLLLTYRYQTNWAREMQENYLPIDVEVLRKLAGAENYKEVWKQHRVLPYLAEQVKADLNIDLEEPTHLKLVLARKS